MAIYHCSIKIISRGKGKSAVASSAYRSGEKITNQYDGITHDFRRKKGIAYTEILLPDKAPIEYKNRSKLWNAVEEIEKNKNSQLARDFEVSLPKELSFDEQKNLVKEFCQTNFISAGMCSDICIHDKGDGNPHAHIMLTVRPFEEDGTWGSKQKKQYILDEFGQKIYDKKKRQYKCNTISTTDWNEQTKAEEWRKSWADVVNKYLEKANIDERIDHRSYERQGVDTVPTIHMGVSASQMEARGIATERGNQNREIIELNKELRQLKARLRKLDRWLNEEIKAQNKPENKLESIRSDNLLTYLKNLTSLDDIDESKSHYKKIMDLKTAANVMNFIQKNDINTLTELQQKVSKMKTERQDLVNSLKRIETDIKALETTLKHADNYYKYKDFYKDYQSKKPKKQQEMYENNRDKITLYESAVKHIKEVLNGSRTMTTDKWRAELSHFKDKRKAMYEKYYSLKDEVLQAETVKKAVDSVIGYHEDRLKNMDKAEQRNDVVKNKSYIEL